MLRGVHKRERRCLPKFENHFGWDTTYQLFEVLEECRYNVTLERGNMFSKRAVGLHVTISMPAVPLKERHSHLQHIRGHAKPKHS